MIWSNSPITAWRGFWRRFPELGNMMTASFTRSQVERESYSEPTNKIGRMAHQPFACESPTAGVPRLATTSVQFADRFADSLEIDSYETVDGVVVPVIFHDQILSHLVRVWLDLKHPFTGALILAIQGPAGSGKSFQTRRVLDSFGIPYASIEASTLAGKYEKDSVLPLYDHYARLGTLTQPAALIIDDFDTSIAAVRDRVERTSNSCILNSFLLHICDNPRIVNGKECCHVPIILTGNDFRSLYPPLLRSGRAHIFTWNPSRKWKSQIVTRMYSGFSLSKHDVSLLLERFADQPPSFFQDILSHLADTAICAYLKASPNLLKRREELQSNGKRIIEDVCRDVTLADLKAIGDRIAAEVAKDFVT
jgi:hypothetical protein